MSVVATENGLTDDERECAAVACSLYADEFSGGTGPWLDLGNDEGDEDFDGCWSFSAEEGLLLKAACEKFCAVIAGDKLEQPLRSAEVRVAAIACDLYAEEFCGEGLSWGEPEAALLTSAADKLCRALNVWRDDVRPVGHALRFA